MRVRRARAKVACPEQVTVRAGASCCCRQPSGQAQVVNDLIRYFDLQSHRRGIPVAHDAGTAPLRVFPQYFAFVLGMVVQPFLTRFRATGSWGDLSWSSVLSWTLFAVLVGLAVFPAVYRRAFDPDHPVFVQFCAVFSSGLGWESLFSAAVKTAQIVTGTKP
jgi:hypothetical protein